MGLQCKYDFSPYTSYLVMCRGGLSTLAHPAFIDLSHYTLKHSILIDILFYFNRYRLLTHTGALNNLVYVC